MIWLFRKKTEGRCPYCGHVRTLHNKVMRQHHYLGSALCEGSGKRPRR